MPAGVTCPCGATSTTLSPCDTPSARASSAPSTTLYSPGLRALRLPPRMWRPNSATRSSSPGRMPRIKAPRTAAPLVSKPCAATNGATATTCSWRDACAATVLHPASVPPGPVNCTCDATPRIRVRISRWKPFITDSTVMSAVMPRAMPMIEKAEMTEMKRVRCLARV
jgi:hypothetical protein